METHDYERVNDDMHDQQPGDSAEGYDTPPAEDAEQALVTDHAIEAAAEAAPPAVEPEPFSRIDFLTYSIEQQPTAPVNYLLRAEAYYNYGDEDLAAQDYAKVLELAEAQVETEDWGYIYESYIDRAHEGLRRCGVE